MQEHLLGPQTSGPNLTVAAPVVFAMAVTVRCILLMEQPNASGKPLGRSGLVGVYTVRQARDRSILSQRRTAVPMLRIQIDRAIHSL